MCGILAILCSTLGADVLRKIALDLSKRHRHRGPDWSGIDVRTHFGPKGDQLVDVLAHERLAIVDLLRGSQPLYDSSKEYILTVNGEIYNHRIIRQSIDPVDLTTQSDCEPIVHLYKKFGHSVVDQLDGVFAFVIAAPSKGNYFAARDPIGVFPLYYGRGSDSSWWFASEVKLLINDCVEIREFPPGHYWTLKEGFHQWYTPPWMDESFLPTERIDLNTLREAFEKAVVKRLMCDVPYGVLLSGGLDSSLVASIVCRYATKRVEEDGKTDAWYPKVHSFTIGLEDSPDLKAAREAADFLQTIHHEFTYSVQEGLDAISDVIYHTETYDVTTIRASIPMFLMARKIKAFGFKMVLSGEGSDELFGGYLYFHKAPSHVDFQAELVRKLKLLSRYDCLRANLTTAAWGIEARVPFLDKEFVNLVMNIDPSMKMVLDRPEGRLEKWILRKAFDTPETPYLPNSILWRQKEQFSDGVGYRWIDSLKAYSESQVTDAQMDCASNTFPKNTPASKEAYLYRSIFKGHFPHRDADQLIPGGPSIACSTPAAIEWEKAWANQADPSGRSMTGVHLDSY